MGLLDSIKSKVSSAVSSVEEKVSDAVKPVEQAAQSAVQTVKDDFQAVAKPVVALAANVVNQLPVVPRSGNELGQDLTRAAHALGSGMQEAGGLLEKGGKMLEPYSPLGGALREVGHDATVFGKGVSAAPEAAAHAVSTLVDDANALATRATNLWGQAKSVLKTGLEDVEKGVKGIVDTAKSYVEGVRDAVDVHKKIDELGPGDTYKLGMGAYGSVEGGKLYGAGSLAVTKGSDGKYTISADGELGGGLYGQLGASAGAKASADGSATLGAGGKVEFKFDNAADAKKAADIMLKQAAAAAGPARPVGVPGSDPGLIKGPSADELKFVSDHMSAVELRGNVAAQAAGTLGVKDVAGGFGGVGVKEEVALRIEMSHPPQVAVRTDVSGNLSLSAGLNVTNGKQGNDNNTGGLPFAGGKAEAKVSVEQRFVLPEGEGSKLLADPLGTIQADAGKVQRTEKDKVTISVDASGGAMGSGGGMQTTVTMNTSPGEITKSGALKQLFDKGDLPGALRSLGDATNVTATATPYQTFGVSLSPSLSVMGFGVGVSVEATRQQMAKTPAWQYPEPGKTATASQAYDQLEVLMKRAWPYAKPQPLQAPIRA